MGKLGRFTAILLPMGFTIISLVCLSLVLFGQTTKHNQLSRDLYFFKANTKGFNPNPKIDLSKIPGNKQLPNDLLKSLQGAEQQGKLKDFYKVGFWGYCEGDISNEGKETVTFCSEHANFFWFNPVEVWKLQNTTAQKLFPEDMQKGLDTYHKVSRWMVGITEIALTLTAAEILIGIAALFSRWGSFVTTMVSTASTVFIFTGAILITTLYAALVAVFESVLKPYNIDATMGKKMLATLWLAVAFSLMSGFFWLISVCCCSGKSAHKKVVVEKTPYTYERVASPYLGGTGNNAHQMQPMHHAGAHGPSGHGTSGNAYEPYRSRV